MLSWYCTAYFLILEGRRDIEGDCIKYLKDTFGKKNTGIGRGIAVELWKCGAQVVAVSRSKSYLDSLKQEYPSIQIVVLDLSDWEQTRKVIGGLGHFDSLVNNAAMGLTEDFLTTTPENFDKLVLCLANV